MPRIADSANEPHDFCFRHMPSETSTVNTLGDEKVHGLGPDNRGNCFAYDCEHPPYEDGAFTCEKCGCDLDDGDA